MLGYLASRYASMPKKILKGLSIVYLFANIASDSPPAKTPATVGEKRSVKSRHEADRKANKSQKSIVA